MNGYLWIKALHIISVISWMAGMLYLPRLFVYHVTAERGSSQSETFKIMERRLLKAIMTPAMVASWIFGLLMVFLYDVGWGDAWFSVKLGLVLLLTACHGYLARCVRAFANDANDKPQRFYRILNEVPTLIMIAVVILVVVKPF